MTEKRNTKQYGMPKKPFKTRKLFSLALLTFALLLGAKIAIAKDLLGGKYKKSENAYVIRTDGLACYFCSYGLERFFRKTKKIYSMDILLKKGLVHVNLVKGQTLIPPQEIKQYIHDAGFSPREITALLIGKISKDGKTFILRESGQKIPLAKTPADLPRQKDISIKGRLSQIKDSLLLEEAKLNN